MNLKKITREGLITRQPDGSHVVMVKGASYVAALAGVSCINPDAAEEERVYSKTFTKKPIYMPHEYERATREILKGTDVIVLGMNGYSSLTSQKCREWGVAPGAYEAACAAILESVIIELEKSYPGVDIRLAHGASELGVDGVILKVAAKLNKRQLGHSCPRFMFYVQDDDVPVYVAKTQVDYANAFIDSLAVLVAANGREQAFKHDINAVFDKGKHVIPVNVLRSISTTGGPPALNADGKIEDAVAYFEQRVHLMYHAFSGTGDPFRDIVNHVIGQVSQISRLLISPERGFSAASVANLRKN
jgi:hypothetical protein